MPLETATYINQLDAANPLGSDPIASGDDHLRLIKAAVKATFPNITGPVTATQAEINLARAPLASPAFTGTPTAPTAASGTNTTQIATTAYVQAERTALLDAVYPVGSIYTNAANATNPATLLGFGTWTAFGAGRVMVGFNAADPLFDTAEETGGSKDAIVVSHTHTATSTVTDPGHIHTTSNHPVWYEQGQGSDAVQTLAVQGQSTTRSYSTASATTGISVATTVASAGESGTNKNLQPYITVYMWKRTA
jgi:hypothetical protein